MASLPVAVRAQHLHLYQVHLPSTSARHITHQHMSAPHLLLCASSTSTSRYTFWPQRVTLRSAALPSALGKSTRDTPQDTGGPGALCTSKDASRGSRPGQVNLQADSGTAGFGAVHDGRDDGGDVMMAGMLQEGPGLRR